MSQPTSKFKRPARRPPARRDREVARTREDMLRGAARAFARRGFEATTMQDIAKEAGYTVAPLYAYFAGKQEIIDALITRLGEGLFRSFEDPMPGGLTFAQRLELLLQRQLEFAEQWQEAFAVMFAIKAEAASSGKRGARRTFNADPFIRRLTTWIGETARPEEIGGRRPEDVAYLLKGVMHAAYQQWLHGDRSSRLADRAVTIANLLLHGVVGPLAPDRVAAAGQG